MVGFAIDLEIAMRTIPAGIFKAKCLAILDEVNQTGEIVLVTKRGKPVARVTAAAETKSRGIDVDSISGALRGLVKINGDPGDLVDPIIPLEDWDHLKEDWSPFPPE